MSAHNPLIAKLINDQNDTPLHDQLLDKTKQLKKRLEGSSRIITNQQAKRERVRQLKDEMAQAMERMDDDSADERPVTKIAADLKRANDAIDRDMDKALAVVDEIQQLQREVTQLAEQLNSVSFTDELV